MIEKSKILDYLKKEIEILDLNYKAFSWMQYLRGGLMERIEILETIKALIESGEFDCKEEIENEQ